jgi:hypothetical protein
MRSTAAGFVVLLAPWVDVLACTDATIRPHLAVIPSQIISIPSRPRLRWYQGYVDVRGQSIDHSCDRSYENLGDRYAV